MVLGPFPSGPSNPRNRNLKIYLRTKTKTRPNKAKSDANKEHPDYFTAIKLKLKKDVASYPLLSE